jgi:hypothetical protein
LPDCRDRGYVSGPKPCKRCRTLESRVPQPGPQYPAQQWFMSDEIGIVQPSPAVAVPRTQGRSSDTGTLQLGRYQVPRWPEAARWAQCTYIDIHFFSGRQKTSSSISILGQILIAGRTCNYLNTGKSLTGYHLFWPYAFSLGSTASKPNPRVDVATDHGCAAKSLALLAGQILPHGA